MCLRPRDPLSSTSSFGLGIPTFTFKKCLENAYQTVKLRKFNEKITRLGIDSYVALYLCLFMLTWSQKKIHSAQYGSILLFTVQHCSCNFDIATISHDILHDWQQSFYIHQHNSTFCRCAPAGVSETTLCNLITSSRPF